MHLKQCKSSVFWEQRNDCLSLFGNGEFSTRKRHISCTNSTQTQLLLFGFVSYSDNKHCQILSLLEPKEQRKKIVTNGTLHDTDCTHLTCFSDYCLWVWSVLKVVLVKYDDVPQMLNYITRMDFRKELKFCWIFVRECNQVLGVGLVVIKNDVQHWIYQAISGRVIQNDTWSWW